MMSSMFLYSMSLLGMTLSTCTTQGRIVAHLRSTLAPNISIQMRKFCHPAATVPDSRDLPGIVDGIDVIILSKPRIANATPVSDNTSMLCSVSPVLGNFLLHKRLYQIQKKPLMNHKFPNTCKSKGITLSWDIPNQYCAIWMGNVIYQF